MAGGSIGWHYKNSNHDPTIQCNFSLSNLDLQFEMKAQTEESSKFPWPCQDSRGRLTDVLPNDPNNFPTLPARRHTRGTQTSCWPTLLQVSSPHVSEVLRMPRSWAETPFNTTSFGVTANKTSQLNLNMIWAWNPLESNNQKWASSKWCIFHVVPCPV